MQRQQGAKEVEVEVQLEVRQRKRQRLVGSATEVQGFRGKSYLRNSSTRIL